MRILDVFAGIGGFSLAAHWMGWETAAFVEWDKDCHRVLQKNFPGMPIYGDIKEFHYEKERDRIGAIDLICGGFPCQPFSSAGKRNGTDDDRYLWPEMLRAIREVRPAWVVGENVAGLITMDNGRVFDEILTSLEDEGYQVETFVIPACAVGAPHRRDRVWIIANCCKRDEKGSRSGRLGWGQREQGEILQGIRPPSHTEHQQRNGRMAGDGWGSELANDDSTLADPGGAGSQGSEQRGTLGEGMRTPRPITERDCNATYPASERRNEGKGRAEWIHGDAWEGNRGQWDYHWLQVATKLCRVPNGVPSELDKLRNSDRTRRLKQLGNSIVPQVVYEIFRAIEQKQNQP